MVHAPARRRSESLRMPLPPGLFVPPPRPLPPLEGLKLHLLGIRGHGMRTVGMAAQAAGARVDGCDRRAGEDSELARHGIALAGNHDPAHVRGRRLVATTVTPADNPELRAALAAGTAHHRSDLLAALLRGRQAVAVTGTHGKGTVAALAGLGLADLGADPLVLLGVEMSETGSNVRIGAGPVVAEVDESDGSVSRIAADVSVVTNVSFDHPQYRRTVAETLGDLAVHVAAVPAHGRVVIGSGRAAASLARDAVAPVWRLGKDFRAHVLEESPTGTSVVFSDPEGGTTTGRLRLRSVYLAEDAALAYAALRACGCPAEGAAAALGRLGGLSRRFEQVGVGRGVTVFDDYGKHPDTIAATLQALRALRPRRLHALYEPHRVAHVRRWGARFAAAFGRADHVVLLPINDRDFGRDAESAADWYRRAGVAAELAAGADEAVLRIARRTRPGDVVCVFGVHDSMAATARALCAAIDGGSRWAVPSEPLAGRAS
jgi:UDP-N-acetylmuramate--alanine ligase